MMSKKIISKIESPVMAEWKAGLEQAKIDLQKHSQAKEYNVELAVLDRAIIQNFKHQLRSIPAEIQTLITRELMTQIGQAIGQLASTGKEVILCICHLPNAQKIQITDDTVKVLDPNAEIGMRCQLLLINSKQFRHYSPCSKIVTNEGQAKFFSFSC